MSGNKNNEEGASATNVANIPSFFTANGDNIVELRTISKKKYTPLDTNKRSGNKDTVDVSLRLQQSRSTLLERLMSPENSVLSPSEGDSLYKMEAVPVDVGHTQPPKAVVIIKTDDFSSLSNANYNVRGEGSRYVMAFENMAGEIRNALQSPGAQHIDFIWHGREAVYLGVEFYSKVLWLQNRFASDDVSFSNSIQTNASDITDEMMMFLHDHSISIEVSFDAPPLINVTHRLGGHVRGASERIHNTLRRLREKQHDLGHLAAIDADIIAMPPQELLEYFVLVGANSLDALDVLLNENAEKRCSDDESNVVSVHVSWPDYVQLIWRLYEIWRDEYQEKFEITKLSSWLNKVANRGRGH